MWKEYMIMNFRVIVKVYENASKFGIKEFPRISKLEVFQFGERLARYDRGWDFNNLPKGVFEMIIKALDAII